MNGDGFSDVIVGAHVYDNGQTDEGRAFVYHGSAVGPRARRRPGPPRATRRSAHFGISVATAGDVNGDGYADVIVGACCYDNGQTDEGRAFVYHGSADGPRDDAPPGPPRATRPAPASATRWRRRATSTATATPTSSSARTTTTTARSTRAARSSTSARPSGLATHRPPGRPRATRPARDFGISVATAGDVNGDGYSDVIVGAAWYDNGQTDEGRAFVYHGSAAGLATSAAWTAESDQASARFGVSVATAGDVNGDGYSRRHRRRVDLRQRPDRRGPRLRLPRLGRRARASPRPGSARATRASAVLRHLGGDGGRRQRRRLLATSSSAPYVYDNGQTDEGRAFVYHGSAAGLGAAPAWTAESDQASAWFGSSVATAGDVNGDGYSRRHRRRAELTTTARPTRGARSSTTARRRASARRPPGPPRATRRARSSALGGDGGRRERRRLLRRDRRAHDYDNGQTNEGRAFVYYGNGGDGLDRIPRQARTDDAAPSPSWVAPILRPPSASRLSDALRPAAGDVRLQSRSSLSASPLTAAGLSMGPYPNTGPPSVRWQRRSLFRNSMSGLSATPSTTGGFAPSATLLSSPTRHGSGSRATGPPKWTCVPPRPAPPSRTSADFPLYSCSSRAFPTRSPASPSWRTRSRSAGSCNWPSTTSPVAEWQSSSTRHRKRGAIRALGWTERSRTRQAPGVYFARLEFNGRVESRKIVLAR